MSEVDDYILDIDSSERDINVYPNINNFEIELKDEIYDISKISIISGKLSTPQLTICKTNKTFQLDDDVITLDEKNYTDGNLLAQDLFTKINAIATHILSVQYLPETSNIVFVAKNQFFLNFGSGINGRNTNSSNTTPHTVLGLPQRNISSSNSRISTQALNFNGPPYLILKISSGSDILAKDIYQSTPYYTGKIHLKSRDQTHYIGKDDPIEYTFRSGKIKTLKSLKFEFFYSDNGRLIPYDFRNSEYSLKLKIKCSRDRFKNLLKLNRDTSLPPPINIPEFDDVDRWEKYKVYIAICIIAIMGIFILYLARPKGSKISE